jgi:predicted lipoprotein with Yx(FWY)xxD motif
MRKLLPPIAAVLLIAGCGGGPATSPAAQPSAQPSAPATTSPPTPTTGPATTPAEEGGTVAVAASKLGKILVDGQGKTLYLFEKDKKGKPTCYDECAAAWEPYVTQGDPAAGDGVKAGLLATVTRKDGARQVVYGGWPLYSYEDDKKPGDVTGQEKEEFGGEWYALGADGKQAEG